MGVIAETKIPTLHLSQHQYTDKDQRKLLCEKIRESCESFGCFILTCPEIIPSSLRENMLMSMNSLFDLPEETKLRYQNPRPYRGYDCKNPVVPLHESFGGIEEAWSPEGARKFTELMWPHGNPQFCETLQAMSWKMREVSLGVMGMICQSFGLEERHLDRLVEDSSSISRLMKYNAPPVGNNEYALGLVPHTDKSFITVLSQNEVQGLEIFAPHGEWIPVMVPHDALFVIVGDPLKAWSNGRLVAVKHRVMIRGGGWKERYSFGVFTVPEDEAVIKVPEELVDHRHPLLYRPFKFLDYFSYFVSNASDGALEAYAGV